MSVLQPDAETLKAQVNKLLNPHEDFPGLEQSRPPFENREFQYTQTKDTNWKVGTGATSDDWKDHETVSIDPYGEGRNPLDNYLLLLSGIVPRPIGFISSLDKEGNKNLAPFSYFNVVCHEPPIFTVGFSAGRGFDKDTCGNLLDTEECTINIISEWFQEAANYASMNAPPGISEWELCGLTPTPAKVVKPPRVAESAFSVEAKLLNHQSFNSRRTGNKMGILCVLEGVYFHVRSDALNEARNSIDPAVLRPISRLGGISYARLTTGFGLPRPIFQAESQKPDVKEILERM